MKRREFFKAGCQLCMLGAFSSVLLESCGAAKESVYKTTVDNHTVTVPLSLFSKGSLQFVRPKGWMYDIAIHKVEEEYTALLMMCTHFDNPLVVGNGTYTCNAHGSVFDAQGQVKKGPAGKALKRYKTTISDQNLIISV